MQNQVKKLNDYSEQELHTLPALGKRTGDTKNFLAPLSVHGEGLGVRFLSVYFTNR